jgi:hypothetical protein
MAQRYGLRGDLANALVTIRECAAQRISLPAGMVSHAASVLYNEGLAVDGAVEFRPAEYEGKHGCEVIAPIGVWLSYEEMEWILTKTREAHERAGNKPTRDAAMSDSGDRGAGKTRLGQ